MASPKKNWGGVYIGLNGGYGLGSSNWKPATWQAAAVVNQRSRENRTPRETDCGNIGSAEPFGPWRRPMSTSEFWTETMIELPGVREGGMSGRNEQ